MKMNTSKAIPNGKPKPKAANRPPIAPPQEEIDKAATEQLESEKEEEDSVWQPIDYIDLRGPNGIDRGEYVIVGVLRTGELMTLGAISKGGKTWAMLNLVWAVVTGGYWMGQQCKQGRVLLIDTELPKRELDYRLSVVASEMQYSPKRGDVITISLRGKSMDIHEIKKHISQMKEKGLLDGVVLIVIDSLYKTMGGINENDNGQMGQYQNELIGLAGWCDELGAALATVHHATKGSQSDKRAIDVFSGAGAIGRNLDTSIVIRDHERDGLAVVDFDVRTGSPLPTVSAKFEWPLWHIVTAEPELRKGGNKTDPKVYETLILNALADEGEGASLSPAQLKKRTGKNADTLESRARQMAKDSKLIMDNRVIGKGEKERTVPYFSLPTVQPQENT